MFLKIFKAHMSPSVKTSLGRWECTNMKLNEIKIDWANVDHCGTCSHTSFLPSRSLVIESYTPSIPTQESKSLSLLDSKSSCK